MISVQEMVNVMDGKRNIFPCSFRNLDFALKKKKLRKKTTRKGKRKRKVFQWVNFFRHF